MKSGRSCWIMGYRWSNKAIGKENPMYSIVSLFLALFLVLLSGNPLPVIAADKATDEEMNAKIGRMGESIVVDPETYKFSAAETMLWMDDHLKNISGPSRLYYEFEKKGSYEDGFEDSVFLEIIHVNDDGTKNTSLEFFTEERNQAIPNDDLLRNLKGNPILGIYLQGDVYEMDRMTEGNWRYFHRLIKLALTDDHATIEHVNIDYDGKTLSGEKITITPYVNDLRRSQFEEFADKRYEFTLSKDIPGTLYQIKTVVPDHVHPANGPLIEETLTLKEVKSSS